MGLFITFEGPDGSGKTTLTTRLADYLTNNNKKVLLTREPGGIGISEKIREIILDPVNDKMDDRTEALLYAASRRQHLVEKVLPAVNEGKIVLCDRFVDSSLAYQGYARGIGIEEVLNINLFAIDNHMPDLTIFIDVDPMIGLSRVGTRGVKDRLELAGNDFHNRVYEGYKKVISMYPDRIKVIDGNRTIDEVFESVVEVIEKVIA